MQTKPHTLILGGGILGICTAYYLHKKGVQVTILEKNTLGSGSSYGNAGWVSPSHVVPLAAPGVINAGLKWLLDPESPFYIKPRMEWDLVKWLWNFQRHANPRHVKASIPVLYDLGMTSLDLFKEICQDIENAFGFTSNGLVYAAATEEGLAHCVEEADFARGTGMRVDDLSAKELIEKEPSLREDLKGGVFFHLDSHMNPAQFVLDLGAYLRRQGVTILEHTEITAIETAGHRIQGVMTSQGRFEADQYVLAAGAWSPPLVKALRLDLPIQAAKGYSVTMPQSAQKTLRPTLLSETKIAVTPLGDQIRYAGTLELAGIDLSINPRRIQAFQKGVPKYMTNFDLEAFKKIKPWSGLRPCTPDGLPFIGRAPQFPNLVVSTGHAMVGVAMATASGKLTAEILQDETPFMNPYPLRLDRF